MTSRNKQQSVEFEVKLPPNDEPIKEELYLAGDFNGWHTADPAYQIKKTRSGAYKLKTKLSIGEHAFKVVRGTWQTVEADKEGGPIANRTLLVEKQPARGVMHVTLEVASWADSFPAPTTPSTVASNVIVAEEDFYIPQLDRTRRVWVYHPKRYIENFHQYYPVIYMLDGQNIFDAATAFSTEWGVDKYLNTLPISQQCLVVAVDNGGNNRMQEYNPYNNKQFGKGEGKAFVEFIVKTLKPYMDRYFRTLKGPENTIICGSSMGGLLSYYAAIKYPDIIGRAGVFSPSFWIASEIFDDTKKRLSALSASSFYFYGGGQEAEDLINQLKQADNLLSENPNITSKLVINPEGQHQEIYWAEAFKGFYTWLLELQAAAKTQ